MIVTIAITTDRHTTNNVTSARMLRQAVICPSVT